MLCAGLDVVSAISCPLQNYFKNTYIHINSELWLSAVRVWVSTIDWEEGNEERNWKKYKNNKSKSKIRNHKTIKWHDGAKKTSYRNKFTIALKAA